MADEAPRRWWQTVPGVLSAVAGLIVAITGLMGILSQTGLLPGPGSSIELPGQNVFRSPDGRYEADIVGAGGNLHYRIREVATVRIVLTTTGEFTTPNDAKAGLFSPDSKLFAAAYHYGHAGGYTWVGVWNLQSSMRVRAETKPGWTADISFVFPEGPH